MIKANLQRTSSWIAADIYFPDSGEFYIRTTADKCYRYANVPEHVYGNYDQAGSQGHALNSMIKTNYQEAEITLAEFEGLIESSKISMSPVAGKKKRKKSASIFKTRIPGFYIVPSCMF